MRVGRRLDALATALGRGFSILGDLHGARWSRTFQLQGSPDAQSPESTGSYDKRLDGVEISMGQGFSVFGGQSQPPRLRGASF